MNPPAAPAVEVQDLLERGTPLVFAVDQAPFQVQGKMGVNTFTILVPLATEGGTRLSATREAFPARGRVWWMLRPELDPGSVVPGSVWTGTLELSNDFKKPDKDWYQISRRSAALGSPCYLQVLDLPGDPDLADLLGTGLPATRPTLDRVLLRGPRNALGPLRAAFQPGEERVRFQALNPGEPFVYRAARQSLDPQVQEFAFNSNQWSSGARRTEVKVALLHDRHLELMKEEGQKVDAATDAQVVNWVFKKLKLQKRDQQGFKDLLARAHEARDLTTEEEFRARVERFRAIVRDGVRIIDLGVEAAEAVAGQEAFRELVEKHKDALVADRLKQEILERRAEIEKEVAGEEQKRDLLRRQVAALDEDFDRRLKEREEKFGKENQARLSELADREARVASREAELAGLEKEVEARLGRVLASYRAEAEKIGDQFLAQLPLLRRAGLLGGPPGADHEAAERPAALPRPAFLDTARPRGDMDEEKFIQQLQHVVERRGFAFELEDLVNFHVCVKTGFWTVLAGASGLGKSSLSRLYAEALGAADEHLLVPVRPDWLDDRDVIGAFNALSGRYEPAPSGLVDRLIAAHLDSESQRGGIYIICLDEMNLARVEHYFAAFLSLLEQPAERRALSLFAPGLERPGDPYGVHRALRVGENVRFVGTVNIDETTHFFSPKVLDRAAIVPLDRPSLELRLAASARSSTLAGIVPVHFEEYRSWIAEPQGAPPSALELLVKVDEALRPSRWGVGFRVRNRILAYVASASRLVGEDRALDLAIRGNIAPRLRPNVPGAEKVLSGLRDLLPPGRFPRTAYVLEAMSGAEGEHDFFRLL